MMCPFGGSFVSRVIPASCSAFVLAKPMWPSRSNTYTGRSEITASMYCLSTFWSVNPEETQPGPVIHVRLERKRAVSGCMPSVDPMLTSIGKVYGSSAVGVILSGMGRDGVLGAGDLVASGGSVLAQDEATSVVWGMPGAVANARLAQAVLPPDELARRIAAWSEGDTAWK